MDHNASTSIGLAPTLAPAFKPANGPMERPGAPIAKYDGLTYRCTILGQPIPPVPPPASEWAMKGNELSIILQEGFSNLWTPSKGHPGLAAIDEEESSSARPNAAWNNGGKSSLHCYSPGEARIFARVESQLHQLASHGVDFSLSLLYYQYEREGLAWVIDSRSSKPHFIPQIILYVN